MSRLRLHVIACRVFEQELKVLTPAAKTETQIQYLEIGLHTGPAEQLRVALQSAIDAVASGPFDAIALAYGLCNRGIVGLQARKLPVIIPRAHDCIGMLLGSSQRYLAELETHPGTYFQSPGWVDHLPAESVLRQQNLPVGDGGKLSREELVARYGEENAAYLIEQFASFTHHYCRLAYIASPVPQGENHEHAAAEIARQQGWTFDCLPGDLGWLRRLLDGEWDEQEFLKLNPGERAGLRYDSQLIAAEPP